MNPVYLFVYGTLQPRLAPESIRHVVEQFVFVANGRTPGLLYDLGEYPGAIFDDAAISDIHGDVYQLPDDGSVYRVLDEYEGAPSLYTRVLRPITVDDGVTLVCWAYAYQKQVDESQLIPSGRYRR